MWKSLNPGDKVLTGDIIRYRSGSPRLTSSQDKVYEVGKTDLHYFEMIVRADMQSSDKPDRNDEPGRNDEPDRKIVKYMDVGYHISLEIWPGEVPYSPEAGKFAGHGK